MSHARLTHPLRPTLEFRQPQSDETNRQAVANIVAELGVDRPPLVHTETREVEKQLRGRVSAPRRASSDPDTSDWRQSLANYVDLLESHVDEYQGDGYTLIDDNLGTSKQAILEAVDWRMNRGSPYEVEFDASVMVGRGTFEQADITRRNPSVNTSMTAMLEIDGEALPGMRDYTVSRSIGVSPRPTFNRSSAENNQILIDEGPQHRVLFEGTITGSQASRESKDKALSGKLATADPIPLKTQFPGYTLDGYVVGYNSSQEVRMGERVHEYSFEFVEGVRA